MCHVKGHIKGSCAYRPFSHKSTLAYTSRIVYMFEDHSSIYMYNTYTKHSVCQCTKMSVALILIAYTMCSNFACMYMYVCNWCSDEVKG